MQTKGFDCATPLKPTTAAAFAADGYSFVARYLVPTGGKRLTKEEAELINEAGLSIVSVYETTADRTRGGSKAGLSDGLIALQTAINVGQPRGSAIYFAVDYDAQPADYDVIEAYLRAAALQIKGYGIGVYGSYAVVEAMRARGASKYFWQTYAWSRGQRSAAANVYQYKNSVSLHGIGVDLDEGNGQEGGWSNLVKPMAAVDVNKIIPLLSAAHAASGDKEAQAEFHRLANELRRVSGQPAQ